MKTNAQRQAEYRARKRNAVTPVTDAVTPLVTPLRVDSNTQPQDQPPLVGQASTVSNVSHCLKSVSSGERGGGGGDGEGGEPLAALPSYIEGAVVKSDQTVRNDVTVKSDHVVTFPRKAEYKDCAPIPATPEQLERGIEVMRAGGLNRDVLAAAGVSSWQALNIGGQKTYGGKEWSALLGLWTAARAQRIIDRAQAVVMQDEPAAVSEASGPLGVTRTEKRETTAPMVAAAMAGLMPEVHGKLANGKGGAITVNGNAAIFGAAPVGTLDDWTPAGLTP